MSNYFSSNIKSLRKKKGITQEKVADELMIMRPTWGAYEEQRAEPHYNRLIEIAKYFKVSIDSLLTEKIE